MKFFIAQLATETNTFAPSPTGWGGFKDLGIFRGNASSVEPLGAGHLLAELRRMAEADGHEVIESICAGAHPLGPTVRQVYETLRDQVLEDLVAAMPVGAVQLMLHGAMVAEGYEDCEGDLIARVRAIVGPKVPIGVELDLHCHFTELMREQADVIICFKEYPHIDAIDRARELYRIVMDTAAGLVRPTTGVADCRMVGLWHTTREPMVSFVKRMQSLEGKDGILSVSFGHGFAWGDVPESGAKVWVVTDADQAGADAVAAVLAAELWTMRDAAKPQHMDLDAALARAEAIASGPIILADIADNPGGGAAGDSTFILRRIIELGVKDYAIGCFWDPGAVQICKDAGEGANIDLRLGGKCGPGSGDPLDLRVTVKKVLEVHAQTAWGMSVSLGTSVWLQAAEGRGDIVATALRCQIYGRDAFTGLGIDLEAKKLVIVKSAQHFHSDFAPIAKDVIYVSTPGVVAWDFANIPYRRRDLNYWPRVENPFGMSDPRRSL
jgi:microcystin degradation protein MlrC